MSKIIAYTDGACKGNGQSDSAPGGYGIHILYPDGSIKNIWGGEPSTTNNRMEMMAVITALAATPKDTLLQIWTDSTYVKDGVTRWLAGWKQKNWRKADGKPVKNLELWQKIDQLTQDRQIDWQWVKGHAGHAGNEMADKLANRGITESGEEVLPTKYQTNDQQTDQMTQDKPEQDKIIKNAKTAILMNNTEQNPDYDGDTSRVNPDFWPVLPKPTHRGQPERQLIMDTETTGKDHNNGDRIVEIGILEMIGRKLTGNTLHVYINPQKRMDDEVIGVHGITNEFVSDKPKFSEVAQAVYDFMVDSDVIAHNASFDMGFLKMEFDKVGLTDFLDRVNVIDSLAVARQIYPGQRNSLDALVKRLDIEQRDRTFHGALLDSQILADVYLKMTGGQIALAIDDSQTNSQVGEQNIQFTDLSKYAQQITISAGDATGDLSWRESVFK